MASAETVLYSSLISRVAVKTFKYSNHNQSELNNVVNRLSQFKEFGCICQESA